MQENRVTCGEMFACFFSQKIKKAENHHKMKRTVANRFKKCMKNAGKTLILQKCLKKQKLIGAENEVYC